jgi:hypothetical protein
MAELAITFGILTTLFWMIIGWRAMKAHERIAKQMARYIDLVTAGDLANLRKENAAQHKQYKQFFSQNPGVDSLPSKERHERFREWLKSRGEAFEEE